jgi:hypothetical protein
MWLAHPFVKLVIVRWFAWAPRRNAQAYRLVSPHQPCCRRVDVHETRVDMQQPSGASSVRSQDVAAVVIERRGVAGPEQDSAQCCGRCSEDRADGEGSVVTAGKSSEPVETTHQQAAGAGIGEAGQHSQAECSAHHERGIGHP